MGRISRRPRSLTSLQARHREGSACTSRCGCGGGGADGVPDKHTLRGPPQGAGCDCEEADVRSCSEWHYVGPYLEPASERTGEGRKADPLRRSHLRPRTLDLWYSHVASAPVELIQCGRSLDRGPRARTRRSAHLLDPTGVCVVGIDPCFGRASSLYRAQRLARDDGND